MLAFLLGYQVYMLSQNDRMIYVWDGVNVSQLYPTGYMPVPNFLLVQNDTFVVINSGGFSGDGSIAFVGDGFLVEDTFPSHMNPMQAVAFGGKFYITDFGDAFNDKVYVHDGTDIVDSFTVFKRPSGITYCNGYIFVASTGMNADYSLDDSSFVHRIDPTNNTIQALKLYRKNANAVECDGNFLYVFLPGAFGADSGYIYKLDANTFTLIDSLNRELSNFYAHAVSQNYIYVATWNGKIYRIDKNTWVVDSFYVVVGNDTLSGVGGMDFLNGKLFITFGGFTGGMNMLAVYDEQSMLYSVHVVSPTDIGLGYVLATASVGVEENYSKLHIKGNLLKLDEAKFVEIYDMLGRKLLAKRTKVVDLSRYIGKLILVRIDGRTYKLFVR